MYDIFSRVKPFFKIIMLYMLGDSRAQGIIPKSFIGNLIGIILLACASIGTFLYVSNNFSDTYFTLYKPDIMLAFFLILWFMLIIMNASGVGILTKATTINEFKLLKSYPITVDNFLVIKVIISLFRGNLFSLLFSIPIIFFILINKGLFSKEIIVSLVSISLFPILPSIIGLSFNLRKQNVNLQYFLVLIVLFINSGIFLIPKIGELPAWLAVSISIITVPAFGILGRLDSRYIILFLLIWISLSVIILIKAYTKFSCVCNREPKIIFNGIISKKLLVKSRKPLTTILSLTIGRLNLSYVLFTFFILLMSSFLILYPIDQIEYLTLKLLFLVLATSSLSVVILFPILQHTILSINERLYLCSFPIKNQYKILIPLFLSNSIIFLCALFLSPVLICLFDLKESMTYYIILFSSLMGTGAFISGATLYEKKICWYIVMLIYIFIKTLIAGYFLLLPVNAAFLIIVVLFLDSLILGSVIIVGQWRT